jgi:hypothetical protein
MFHHIYNDEVAWNAALTIAGHTDAAFGGSYGNVFHMPRGRIFADSLDVLRALVDHLMPHLDGMEDYARLHRGKRGDVRDVSMALRHMGQCLVQSVLVLGDR